MAIPGLEADSVINLVTPAGPGVSPGLDDGIDAFPRPFTRH